MDLKSKIILIAGPTASGKSNFSIKLAKKIDGEIINADSMQIYKQLKILSARPDPKNYQKVKHHLYGFQDVKDDEIIGVKSTSIKFKNDPKKILFISYSIFILSMFLIGILMNFKIYYFLFMIIPTLHLLFFQIKKLNTNVSTDCLNKFKSNNFLGLVIFANILVGKLL